MNLDREIQNINIMGDDELQDILAECSTSLRMISKVLFPARFYRDFDRIHDEIFELLDDLSETRVSITAPRGVGKYSIVQLSLCAQNILFNKSHYIVPISATEDSAVEQSENLKRELLENEMISALFGNMKSSVFAKETWITGKDSDIMIKPRGMGQQVRGRLYGNYRPDLILGDDIEDRKKARNEEYRKELWRWWNSDVMNSTDIASDNSRIVVIGSMLHEDGFMARLEDSKEWTSINVAICTTEYVTLAPYCMPQKKLDAKVESARDNGELDLFCREFMGERAAVENAIFKQSYFQNYVEEELVLGRIRHMENIVLVDPAKTINPMNANSAIVGIGIDIYQQALYVRDVIDKQMMPDDMYEDMFAMAKYIKARAIGVEVTSLENFITGPIEQYMAVHNLHYEMIWLKARGGVREEGKDGRIRTLIPFYRRGHVYHNPTCCGTLEQQLMSFPFSKKKDVMDCLAYVTPMLAEGGRFFLPESWREEDEEKALEAEMVLLEEEEDLYENTIEEWRTAP